MKYTHDEFGFIHTPGNKAVLCSTDAHVAELNRLHAALSEKEAELKAYREACIEALQKINLRCNGECPCCRIISANTLSALAAFDAKEKQA